MKIGILSDTHGNLPATERAALLMAEQGIGAVFHCGDIGSFDVLSKLAAVFQSLDVPVYAVFGNVDAHSNGWKFFPSSTGLHLLGRFGEVELDGRNIAVLHSDDLLRLNRAVESGDYDLVLTGHSHQVHDYMEGKTRCINPGTAGRSNPGTCAVLDLDSGDLLVLNC